MLTRPSRALESQKIDHLRMGMRSSSFHNHSGRALLYSTLDYDYFAINIL